MASQFFLDDFTLAAHKYVVTKPIKVWCGLQLVYERRWVMAFQEASGFCKNCNKQVMIRRKGTNHILHLLLTLITFGFWIIIWVAESIKIGGWRCTQCGKGVSRQMFA
jgi:hypothetical protein